MYRRILVATGGSPWSEAAVAYALRLAARLGAELRILTVLTMPTASLMSDTAGVFDLLMDSVEHEGKMRLYKAASRATWAGVPYETLIKWGNIPDTILQAADEEACELIVLGSRRLTGWKRLMLGSISNAVAARAPQPVLVVKRTDLPRSQAFLWRRVLVATDGSPWSDAAVDHALGLAQAHHSAICLLHVERTRPPAGDGTAPADGKNLLALAAARAAAAGVPFETHLAQGNVVETVLDTAASLQCDGIVLGSRGLTGWKRLMLGSISNAVAAKALQPVLIVKRFMEHGDVL
jgi:nucleotide-binding universal stress UspA family protein